MEHKEIVFVCPDCNGSGWQYDKVLTVIDGHGFTTEEQRECKSCGGLGVISGPPV